MAPDVRTKRASDLEKRGRERRLTEGLCTRCRKEPTSPDSRMCPKCQAKGRKYVMRNFLKKRGALDEW
jgi:hypothetical protein